MTPRCLIPHSALSLLSPSHPLSSFFFFFNDTATTEIYTLSLHDALPISRHHTAGGHIRVEHHAERHPRVSGRDRKSTRLNSRHTVISYAVFCLKKKKGHRQPRSHSQGAHRPLALRLLRSPGFLCSL